MGHSATVIYLTRGERGIPGKSNDEAAAIRSLECEAACRIIGAKALFAGQIDGSADFTRARVDELKKMLAAEKPDIVFTHWPIDTHMDHQVASMCTIRAAMALQPRPQLYFFEVNTGARPRASRRTLTWMSRRCWRKRRRRCSRTSARTAKESGATTMNHSPSGAGREAGVKFRRGIRPPDSRQ
jgi:LmbE family N-acetylglucosaminyl deacetylase